MSKADKLARKKQSWAEMADCARVDALKKLPPLAPEVLFRGAQQKVMAAQAWFDKGMAKCQDRRLARGIKQRTSKTASGRPTICRG